MKKIGLVIIIATTMGLYTSNVSLLAQPKNEGLNNTPPPNKSSKKDDMWDEAAKRVMRVEELTKKAESGDVVAQIDLGFMLFQGNGIEKDAKQAAFWFQKAADQGHVLAEGMIGWMYYAGIGIEQDYIQAMVWTKKAAEQGNELAQYLLGEMYSKGEGTEKDYAIASRWFRKAAEQGNVLAQSILGEMYVSGQGVEKDYKQAAGWLRKAAEQGNMKAQGILGVMLQNGLGVDPDIKQAVEWYHKAAEQGNVPTQFVLGGMYYDGNGVTKDLKQAAKWYHKAAEKGVAEAQYNIGLMFYKGEGVAKDHKQAAKWYLRAAEQGHPRAQLCLGGMYYSGQGVIEDYIEAYKWILLAGMNEKDAIEVRKTIQPLLTEEQLAKAQKMAKVFVPRKEGPEVNEADPFGIMERGMMTTGTGFFIHPDGWIVTAHHVIEKTKTIRIMAGEKILDAKVVAADAGLDIAILKVDGQGFEWLPIAASAGVKAGEKIFTVGYPNYAIQGTEPKYTEGVVSSLTGAMNNPRLFQVSAQVQPGNSGGPLVTEAGQVIGVVVQRLSDLGMLEATGMVAQSVNYAVKSSFVLPLLEGVEGWTRPEGKTEKPDRTAIIERARKAAVMVMGY